MRVLHGKVLIIVENLPVPFDRRVWMESNALYDAGYDVTVICPKGKGYELAKEIINNVTIYRHSLPKEKSSAFGYIREYSAALYHEWRLARTIYKEKRFNLIHACNPPDLIFLIALWFKIFHKVKFIFDHHDLNPELYESKFQKKGIFYYLLKIAEKFTFKTADIVISTNESYKEIAINRGGKNPSHVFVVRSGPDLEIFKPVKPNLLYKKGKKFLIGYLGVMGEFDGVDHLIRSADYIVNELKRTDIQFCLIGGGPSFDSLVELSEKLNLINFIEFTGRIPDNELIERLCTCDVCVDPDPKNPLNDKSTMNKILEYMALSRPIVQYDLLEGRRSAENASLYAEPDNIVELAEKILSLLDNSEKREKMGTEGYIRMKNLLEWNHQKLQLYNAYNSVAIEK